MAAAGVEAATVPIPMAATVPIPTGATVALTAVAGATAVRAPDAWDIMAGYYGDGLKSDWTKALQSIFLIQAL